jgi:hypothetical protein
LPPTALLVCCFGQHTSFHFDNHGKSSSGKSFSENPSASREIQGEKLKVELKRGGGKGGKGGDGGGDDNVKPGDWRCPKCSFNNFARR